MKELFLGKFYCKFSRGVLICPKHENNLFLNQLLLSPPCFSHSYNVYYIYSSFINICWSSHQPFHTNFNLQIFDQIFKLLLQHHHSHQLHLTLTNISHIHIHFIFQHFRAHLYANFTHLTTIRPTFDNFQTPGSPHTQTPKNIFSHSTIPIHTYSHPPHSRFHGQIQKRLRVRGEGISL